MGKIKKLALTEAQRFQLENGFRHGITHCFRMRCRAVLLKADGLSSEKAGEQTGMSLVSVNAWVKRFLMEGLTGLKTRPGRGRKPIMGCSDEAAVRRAIEQDRQSVSKAKLAWQESTGKEASDLTFKRFLSSLAQDIDV
jgi:transposase